MSAKWRLTLSAEERNYLIGFLEAGRHDIPPKPDAWWRIRALLLNESSKAEPVAQAAAAPAKFAERCERMEHGRDCRDLMYDSGWCGPCCRNSARERKREPTMTNDAEPVAQAAAAYPEHDPRHGATLIGTTVFNTETKEERWEPAAPENRNHHPLCGWVRPTPIGAGSCSCEQYAPAAPPRFAEPAAPEEPAVPLATLRERLTDEVPVARPEHDLVTLWLESRIQRYRQIVAENPYTSGNDGLRDMAELKAETLEEELRIRRSSLAALKEPAVSLATLRELLARLQVRAQNACGCASDGWMGAKELLEEAIPALKEPR